MLRDIGGDLCISDHIIFVLKDCFNGPIGVVLIFNGPATCIDESFSADLALKAKHTLAGLVCLLGM